MLATIIGGFWISLDVCSPLKPYAKSLILRLSLSSYGKPSPASVLVVGPEFSHHCRMADAAEDARTAPSLVRGRL